MEKDGYLLLSPAVTSKKVCSGTSVYAQATPLRGLALREQRRNLAEKRPSGLCPTDGLLQTYASFQMVLGARPPFLSFPSLGKGQDGARPNHCVPAAANSPRKGTAAPCWAEVSSSSSAEPWRWESQTFQVSTESPRDKKVICTLQTKMVK